MKRFSDRFIIVTGGASGIGLAAAQRLAVEGARVALVDLNEERLPEALATLEGEGHSWHCCDATDAKAVKTLVRGLAKEHGPIWGAVLAAGTHGVRPIGIAKPEHFSELFSTNVITATNVIAPFTRAVDKTRGGAIVLMSSGAATRGNPGVSAYSAAKGALLSLNRALAMELAPQGIRVNAVVAGVVDTPMSQHFLGSLTEEQAETVRDSHPLGVGKPEDVAGPIAFLLSDDARWITGAALVADGGLTAK